MGNIWQFCIYGHYEKANMTKQANQCWFRDFLTSEIKRGVQRYPSAKLGNCAPHFLFLDPEDWKSTKSTIPIRWHWYELTALVEDKRTGCLTPQRMQGQTPPAHEATLTANKMKCWAQCSLYTLRARTRGRYHVENCLHCFTLLRSGVSFTWVNIWLLQETFHGFNQVKDSLELADVERHA